jgi:integrase/recombinase XerD
MEPLLTQLINEIGVAYPGADLLQLRVKVAAILAAYDIKPAKILISHPDIAEKVKLFLAAKRLEGLSPSTLAGYGIELRIFGSHFQKPVKEITTSDIRDFLSRFEGLKLSSLARKLSVLKSFFSWLADEEMIDKDPTRKIKPPKTEKRLPKALSIEELEMMREMCKTTRERAMVEVFYATGGRLSEIQQLDRQDIDWVEKSSKVLGKGNKEREVFLSVKASYHLKKYLSSREDDNSALFVTERKPHRRLSKRGIQREFKIIAARAGIKKRVHPHVMRHTMATLTLNNGADLVAVQELLGHVDPGTTQVYAQLSNERKKESHRRYLVQ